MLLLDSRELIHRYLLWLVIRLLNCVTVGEVWRLAEAVRPVRHCLLLLNCRLLPLVAHLTNSERLVTI